jgi:hypothetical protein
MVPKQAAKPAAPRMLEQARTQISAPGRRYPVQVRSTYVRLMRTTGGSAA